MAELDEEYRPSGNSKNVFVAVKTDAEEEEESLTQRLLRESAAYSSLSPNKLH
jgi:hypothetical protein